MVILIVLFIKYIFIFLVVVDAEVRAILNSYQYLKRLLSERLETKIQSTNLVCCTLLWIILHCFQVG